MLSYQSLPESQQLQFLIKINKIKPKKKKKRSNVKAFAWKQLRVFFFFLIVFGIRAKRLML